jgi:hypothetical protein
MPKAANVTAAKRDFMIFPLFNAARRIQFRATRSLPDFLKPRRHLPLQQAGHLLE